VVPMHARDFAGACGLVLRRLHRFPRIPPSLLRPCQLRAQQNCMPEQINNLFDRDLQEIITEEYSFCSNLFQYFIPLFLFCVFRRR
jgi:hypothetical protein